jgi:hypothetical protein
MPWIDHDGNYPTGYGEADKSLADRVFNAPTKDAADAEAAKDGLQNAEDAVGWLASRSESGRFE